MPIIEKNKQIIDENLSMKRHSLSHILAEAVQNLFPDALLGIGPAIENGFYYDFDIEKAISEKDIQSIQKEMTKIISQNRHFIKKEISIDEAKVIFRNKKEIYKLELIDELEQQGEKTVSLYYNGEDNWFDLCKGPHIEQSDEINIEGLKLDFVAGAYWKGSEKNKMMQRIYGLYFNSKKELDDYIKQLEEAKEKDHRKIGKELGIYMISDIVGKGLPMLLPKGATLKRILERWTVDEELKRGYEHIQTPVLGKVELYQISGHIEHYKDSMYRPIDIDGEQFILRPMSCPHHFMMYKSEPHSYRDLPLRYAEISPLYRYEKSGELSGLIRLRNFTLADAHIFCTKEQVKDEFKSVINLVQYMMTNLGIERKVW
jgi:threonyl-tRNA synthetase